jgi:hypothetical protein
MEIMEAICIIKFALHNCEIGINNVNVWAFLL